MKTTKIVRASFLSCASVRAFAESPAVRELWHDNPPQDDFFGGLCTIRVLANRRGLRHAVREAAFAHHAIRVETIVLK